MKINYVAIAFALLMFYLAGISLLGVWAAPWLIKPVLLVVAFLLSAVGRDTWKQA